MTDLTNKFSNANDIERNGSIMNNPLYDNLFGVHSENDDPFLYLLDGKTITYRQFLATSGRIANTLVEMGLEPGTALQYKLKNRLKCSTFMQHARKRD